MISDTKCSTRGAGLWSRAGYPQPTLQPSQVPCLCGSYADWTRFCMCVIINLWTSYLDQIPNYTDESLFNAVLFVEIHKQAGINISWMHPLLNTEIKTRSHTQAGGTRHLICYSTPSPHLRHPHIPLWPPQHSAHSHYSNLTQSYWQPEG